MSTPFVWFDHRSDDPTGAVDFYRELLGWQPADPSPPGVTALAGPERPWGGMAESDKVPNGWLPYVQVESLDGAAEEARRLGAKLLKPRTTGPAGDYVVIEDPAGGVLALWTPA